MEGVTIIFAPASRILRSLLIPDGNRLAFGAMQVL